MATVTDTTRTRSAATTAAEGPSINNSRRSSRSMLDGNKIGKAAATEPSAIRLGAAHDLPSSVAHFLYLSSRRAPTTAAGAKKELRRQLLVLRDYCVSSGNKTKDKELLSQGGKHISRKTEATPDFNSCLDVIFATSLVFTSETEDVAKDTLRSIVAKLKAVQETGDERAFRAAVVEVVNRILLCTPLAPPARDSSTSDSPAAEEAAAAERKTQLQNGGKKHRSRAAATAAEPRLRDECLDFLTVEDGTPVLLERVWKRWLNYFEQGYVRYVERLRAEQQRTAEAAAAAAAAAQEDDEDDEDGHGENGAIAENGNAAAAAAHVPVIAAVPFFTARQSYWKSTTSAYAQFAYLLLAIYFVRTTDFSLNYLARVTKLVQYYAYQLESEDGEPIAVKESAAAASDENTAEEMEEDEEVEEEPSEGDDAEEGEATPAEPAAEEVDGDPSQSEAAVQTDAPEPDQPAAAEEAAAVRSLPTPQYDESATRRTLLSARPSAAPRTPPPPTLAKPERQRRRGHKCFATEELPEELRPSVELATAEEMEAEARNSEAHSHVPAVRLTERIDLPDPSQSRSRERAASAAASKADTEAQGEEKGEEGRTPEKPKREEPEEIAKDNAEDAAEEL